MDFFAITITVYNGLLTAGLFFIFKMYWSEIQYNREEIKANKKKIVNNKDKVVDDDRDIYAEMNKLENILTKVETQINQIFIFMRDSSYKEEKQDNKIERINQKNR